MKIFFMLWFILINKIIKNFEFCRKYNIVHTEMFIFQYFILKFFEILCKYIFLLKCVVPNFNFQLRIIKII